MRDAIVALAGRRQNGHNPGLLLQRYLARAADKSEEANRERRSLFHCVTAAARSEALRSVYEPAFKRWQDSFPPDDLHPSCELQTWGRLIVGLGSENVLETGIRLHHTYGVPLIPGSALKGLASHYCHEVLGQRHLADSAPDENRRFRRPTPAEDEAYRGHLRGDPDAKPVDNCFRLLFGNTDDGGVITFHDAWITPASLADGPLRLDVMTPHHSDFQRGPDDPTFREPTDFDSPVPVSFLSVAGTFQVRLSWCGPSGTPRERARDWTTLAKRLLQEALAEWGVGGKTSSGYGRLVAADAARPAPAAVVRTQTPRPEVRQVPRPGTRVEVVLLEAKTKKGGWKARHEPSGSDGPVQNSGDVPADKKPGDKLTLIVASAEGREVAFRYPTAADEQRAQRPKGKPGGGPGGQRPRR